MGAVEKPSSHGASRDTESGDGIDNPGLIWEALERALEDLSSGEPSPSPTPAPNPPPAPAPNPASPEAIRSIREVSVLLESMLHKALPVALPVHGPQALTLLIEQAHASGMGDALGTSAGALDLAIAVRNQVLAHARATREGRTEPAPDANAVREATGTFETAIQSLDRRLAQALTQQPAQPSPATQAPPRPAAAAPAPQPEPTASLPPTPAPLPPAPVMATAEILILPPPAEEASAEAAIPSQRPRHAPRWLKSLGSMAATLCLCALGLYAGTKWLDPNTSLEVLRSRAEALCWETQALDPADGFSKAQDRIEALRRDAQALYQLGRKGEVRGSYQEIIAHCETLARLDRERQSARFARQRLEAREPESPALARGDDAYQQKLFAQAEQIWTKGVPVSMTSESGVVPSRDSDTAPVSLTRAEGTAKPIAVPAEAKQDSEPPLPEPAPAPGDQLEAPAPLPVIPAPAAAPAPQPLPETIAPSAAAEPSPAATGADPDLAARVDNSRESLERLKVRFGPTPNGPESGLWSRVLDLERTGAQAEAKGDLDTALATYRRAEAMLPEAYRETTLARARAAAEAGHADEGLDLLARLLADGEGPGTDQSEVQALFDQIAPRAPAWWLARAREQANGVPDPAPAALAKIAVASVSRDPRDFEEAALAAEAIADPLAKADAGMALAVARNRAGATPEAVAVLRRTIAALESAPEARWPDFADLVQTAGAIGDRALWQSALDASFRARPSLDALRAEIPGLTPPQYDQYWAALYHLLYGEVTAARRVAEALGAREGVGSDPYLFCALARGAAALGDLDESRPLIEQATTKLQAAKGLSKARRADCQAELALAYALLGQVDEASRLTAELNTATNRSRICRVIAQHLARQGHLDEAETALDEITDPAERVLAARSLTSVRCGQGDWLRIARWSDNLPAPDLRAVSLTAIADAVRPRPQATATQADGEAPAATR